MTLVTDDHEVEPRPSTGETSTSIRMGVVRVGRPIHSVDWPVEWRVPGIGEVVRFAAIGVIRVTGVIWEHESGLVTLWAE